MDFFKHKVHTKAVGSFPNKLRSPGAKSGIRARGKHGRIVGYTTVKCIERVGNTQPNPL